jgi:hypothetical protein
MAPSRRIAALVAVTALGLSACSSNDADAGDIEEAMLDAGLSQDEASCMAQQLDDELDQGQLNDLAAASAPDEFPEGLEDTVADAVDECVGSSAGTDSTEGSDSTEGDSGEGGEPSDSTDDTSDTTADEGSSETTATTAG